jgi:hypothetical protein
MDYARTSPRKLRVHRRRAYPKNIDVMAQLLEAARTRQSAGIPGLGGYITEDKMVATKRNASDCIENHDGGAGGIETRL